jgi:hypothetical protein
MLLVFFNGEIQNHWTETWWAGRDSNALRRIRLSHLRSDFGHFSDSIRIPFGILEYYNMVGREGFEPPKAKPKDLQSSPFDHSGTDPCIKKWSHLRDLNSRPPVYKTGALPTELRWHVRELYKKYPFCQNFFPN